MSARDIVVDHDTMNLLHTIAQTDDPAALVSIAEIDVAEFADFLKTTGDESEEGKLLLTAATLRSAAGGRGASVERTGTLASSLSDAKHELELEQLKNLRAAEITKVHAEAAKATAEARRASAEAREIELRTAVSRVQAIVALLYSGGPIQQGATEYPQSGQRPPESSWSGVDDRNIDALDVDSLMKRHLALEERIEALEAQLLLLRQQLPEVAGAPRR
jgi:hypothetical protein